MGVWPQAKTSPALYHGGPLGPPFSCYNLIMEKLRPSLESDKTSSENIINNHEAIETERVFLGRTQDGAEVYDRLDSHFHGEGGLTPELLEDAIGRINTGGKDFVKERVDYDHPVGEQTCVGVGPEDEIVMVYRKGRSGQTPMVKNREAEPCNSVMVILRKDRLAPEEATYEMLTSYVGEGSPREPWDPGLSTEEECKESEEYWRTHALIYDDSLIDWVKTKEFEFMSPSMQERELIRPKVLYSGLFVDPSELYGTVQPTLERPIKTPHVTTAFKPNLSQLNLEQLGSEARIFAIGYGNDGQNEGLLVRVEADDPAIQKACDSVKTPHITLSISKNGQAKDTANLEFAPIETPFEITGQYGLYSQGGPVFNRDDLTPKTSLPY